MIPEISTSIQMCANDCVHSGPRQDAGFAHAVFVQGVEQQRPQNGPEPEVRGDIETFLVASDDGSRQTILHEFAHALNLIPEDSLRADPTGQQSQKNDAIIDEKCGRGLNRLPVQ